jgi:hypothetical protein
MYAETIQGGSPSIGLLLEPGDISRSPDLVDGRVVPPPLLVESLLCPPRVFGRPAAPFGGLAGADVFLVAAPAGAFLGDESVAERFGWPALFVALPRLPLLERVLG